MICSIPVGCDDFDDGVAGELRRYEWGCVGWVPAAAKATAYVANGWTRMDMSLMGRSLLI